MNTDTERKSDEQVKAKVISVLRAQIRRLEEKVEVFKRQVSGADSLTGEIRMGLESALVDDATLLTLRAWEEEIEFWNPGEGSLAELLVYLRKQAQTRFTNKPWRQGNTAVQRAISDAEATSIVQALEVARILHRQESLARERASSPVVEEDRSVDSEDLTAKFPDIKQFKRGEVYAEPKPIDLKNPDLVLLGYTQPHEVFGQVRLYRLKTSDGTDYFTVGQERYDSEEGLVLAKIGRPTRFWKRAERALQRCMREVADLHLTQE